MKLVLAIASRIAGTMLIALAVLIWIGAEVSTDSPFRLFLIPGPEAVSQVLRWLVIAILGALGAFLWTVSGTR